jgi:predicted transcriptional regulator
VLIATFWWGDDLIVERLRANLKMFKTASRRSCEGLIKAGFVERQKFQCKGATEPSDN